MGADRSPDPLTLDQLRAVKEAAARLTFRHRLIANIVPHTGLFRPEFTHLNRDWLVYRKDGGSGDIEGGNTSPDSVIIHIPRSSPCIGTLKFDRYSNNTGILEREGPCRYCRPDGVWEPEYDHRVGRRILVDDESAVDVIHWWFKRYDSIPISRGPSTYGWIDDIADEAGLSRRIGFRALRRTFGVLLIERGADRETVANWMGVENRRGRLEPLYDASSKEMPTRYWSREELVEELQRLADRLGRPPTASEIREMGEVTPETYLNRFGGLDDALEEAGIQPVYGANGRIREWALIEELQRLADKLGHPPTRDEISEEGEFDYKTYLNRFGGLKEALEAAGLVEE